MQHIDSQPLGREAPLPKPQRRAAAVLCVLPFRPLSHLKRYSSHRPAQPTQSVQMHTRPVRVVHKLLDACTFCCHRFPSDAPCRRKATRRGLTPAPLPLASACPRTCSPSKLNSTTDSRCCNGACVLGSSIPRQTCCASWWFCQPLYPAAHTRHGACDMATNKESDKRGVKRPRPEPTTDNAAGGFASAMAKALGRELPAKVCARKSNAPEHVPQDCSLRTLAHP